MPIVERSLCGVLLFVASACVAVSQVNTTDPLSATHQIRASDEVSVLVLSPEGPINEGDARIRHILLDYDSIAKELVELPAAGWLTDQVRGDTFNGFIPNVIIDTAVVDVNGDALEDVLMVWEGPNLEPMLRVQNAAAGAVSTTSLTSLGLPPLRDHPSWQESESWMFIDSGDVDADGMDDVVLAYIADGHRIMLACLGVDGAGGVTLKQQQELYAAPGDLPTSARHVWRSLHMRIAVGDFDGIGADEIAVLWGRPLPDDGEYGWEMLLELFSYSAEQGFTLQSSLPAPIDWKPQNSSEAADRMALATGDLNSDGVTDLGVAYQTTYVNGGGNALTRLQSFTWDTAEDRLGPLSPLETIRSANGGNPEALGLDASDIDGDGDDDLLVRMDSRVSAYDGRTAAEMFQIPTASDTHRYSHLNALVTDLDAGVESILTTEIVVAEWDEVRDTNNAYLGRQLRITVYAAASREVLATYTRLFSGSSASHNAHVFLTGVDADGDSIRLGTPRMTSRSEIVQPLVILNAPPTHFDLIDGTIYDLNDCHSSDPLVNCGASATYTRSQQVIQEVSAEIHSDWAVSDSFERTIEGELGPVGGAVTKRLESTYGNGFSKVSGSGTSLRQTFQVTAIDEDQIIASLADYTIYEYPVYSHGLLQGHVVVVVPHRPVLSAFGVKSTRAAGYVPSHEAGNILSYKSETAASDDPLVDRTIKTIEGFRWNMQNQGLSEWTLEMSQYSQQDLSHRISQSVSSTKEVKFEAEQEFEIPVISDIFGSASAGITLETSSSDRYSSHQISTHSVAFRTDQTLAVNFGTIDGAILGSNTYDVLPYVYWAGNGALVVDYAVEPSKGFGVQSWFEQHYGHKPDLALLLPWRHDIEKGLGASPDQTLQTRNIAFNPIHPPAGQEVDVFVRVHNYSMQTQPSPASNLRFYLGDPATGGQLMIGGNGESLVRVPPIPPRDYRIVALRAWRVPYGLTLDTRVYVVLDPDGQIDEIHENNNKGWTLIESRGGNLWHTREDNGEGWKLADGFGWFYDGGFPLIYHLENGYLHYNPASTPDSHYYWDFGLNAWIWSSPTTYPYIYSFNTQNGGWLYYFRGATPGDRWFFHFTSNTYIHEAQF